MYACNFPCFSCSMFFLFAGKWSERSAFGEFIRGQALEESTKANALVIVMTLGGETRDRPGSFVKEHVTHQRQFVILRFPAGGKFAITAHVEILVLFLQKLHLWSEGRPWLKWVTRN